MFPGRGAAKARLRAFSTRCGGAEWCAADPGSSQTESAKIPDQRCTASGTQGFINTFGKAPGLVGRGLVKAYQYTLSWLTGARCRHLPTCSDYADQAIERFGLWAGGWMTLARLCRCHPFGTAGLDFVADALPPRARWYLPWRYGRWRGVNDRPATA